MHVSSLTLTRRSFLKASAHLLALVAGAGGRMSGVAAQAPAPGQAYGVGAYGAGAYGPGPLASPERQVYLPFVIKEDR